MPSFTVVTFGCQMNQHDSGKIVQVMRRAGYRHVDAVEAADVVLFNTCSVRERAEQKLLSEVGRVRRLKQANPALVIGVAGCMAQQEGERLAKRLPDVDLVLGPDNIPELPGLLAEAALGGPQRVRTVFDLAEPRFLASEPGTSRGVTAYVTVMKGCNERCSFCIVPYTRGPERYRPAHEIIEEIATLVDDGVREVTLLGQTVNSYRDPFGSLPAAPSLDELSWSSTSRARSRGDESEFAALLRAIAERVPKLARLRYTSPHPRHLTQRLIRAHRDLAVLPRHVHLPVQSGSDRVLKRMLRRYSVAEYLERVDALKRYVPGITLSTDVIVGFPGETAEEFACTLEVVREVGFTGLFGFKYSPRPHTPAQRLEGSVDEPEKSRRLEALFALSDRLRLEHLASMVESEQRVLVEGRSRGGAFSGRTERNEIVHVKDAGFELTGEVVHVRVREAFKNSLGAELVVPPPSGATRPVRAAQRSLPLL
jgi:tRNA-2-methylthio-N6-dimethylallyladenosine synthase